jgi:excisionase family DNA binding protein
VTLDELIQAGRHFATVAETCSILEVEERTIYAGIKNGEIPSTRVGNRHKIPVAWLRKAAAVDDTPAPAGPVIPEQFAAAVADRVVARLARAFAELAELTPDAPTATRDTP